MNKLWNFFDAKAWRAETKWIAAALVYGIPWALAGLALWALVRNWCLSSWDWMVCFAGYPAAAAYFRFYLYCCAHDLHDGSPSR